MTNYWIIAPYDVRQSEHWERIWQYDLAHNVISIGWGDLGDVSRLDKNQLQTVIAQAYPDKSPQTKTKILNMIWSFFHDIEIGDIIIARKGTKRIAAAGIVTHAAYFSREKNAEMYDSTDPHYSYIGVEWLNTRRGQEFAKPQFGIQTITRSSKAQFNRLIGVALYLNGVSETVLKEILVAQEDQQHEQPIDYYLQPHAESKIVYLSESDPTPENPIQLYISTSGNLEQVTYRAKIVRWEDKQAIPNDRLEELNQHIQQFQPKEEAIYHEINGKPCKNLLTIRSLEKLPHPFPVSNLIKTSDGTPHQTRTQSGRWSPVFELPDWVGELQPQEKLEEGFSKEVEKAKQDSPAQRRKRLENASKIPEKVPVASFAYRRNPDVVAEVLHRANGKCEACQADAPFRRKSDGNPYLEVHHCRPLADGGEDTVENAIAVCPNCHRRFHYGDGEYKIENGRCVAS